MVSLRQRYWQLCSDAAERLLPLHVQGAKTLSIDRLTLYASAASKVAPVTPTVDLGTLSTSLSGPTGAATLSLPADPAVMTRDITQQVFLIMQYSFSY